MTNEEIIKAVRWRNRIWRYLLTLGTAWLILGKTTDTLSPDSVSINVQIVGIAIMTAAFVLSLAVYRCPVCDRYLGLNKERCPHCGAKLR